MSIFLQDKTWPQIKAAIEAGTVLLLPLGQTEQHGQHLQTGCDTIIADRVAQAVAQKINPEIPTLVMPSIPYGYVPKSVTEWPGTFRIGWETMVRYIADVCCSAIEMGFRKLVIVSTHGPHGDVARLAARDVFDRTGIGVVVSMPHGVVAKRFAAFRKSKLGGTSHACEYETSLLMHFGYPVDVSKTDDRDSVKVVNEWIAGDMLGGSGKVSWSTWALQMSETGTYGDPSCATPETGRKTFEAIIDEYCKLLRFVQAQKMPEQKFKRYPGNW
jgi:creatinine amidohydrolase